VFKRGLRDNDNMANISKALVIFASIKGNIDKVSLERGGRKGISATCLISIANPHDDKLTNAKPLEVQVTNIYMRDERTTLKKNKN